MLAGKLQSVQVPANVNDTDIYPGMEAPISSREGFTDMSFSLMGHDGEPLVRKLVYVQGGETRGERLEIEQNWHKRQEGMFFQSSLPSEARSLVSVCVLRQTSSNRSQYASTSMGELH